MTTGRTLAGVSRDPAASIRFRASFHFAMALLMAMVVVYGFSQTFIENLIHPPIPRPAVLYVHATVFSAWMALYVLQTGLVACGNVPLHRRLGLVWIAIGGALPVVGVATGIVMRRFRFIHDHEPLSFFAISLTDMVLFAAFFVLAVRWRKRPEFHKRLMLLATCCLLDAAFMRFPVPDAWFVTGWFYAAVDVLVLLAVARDLIVGRRIHVVYAAGLIVMVVGQFFAWSLWRHPPEFWVTICRGLTGVG